MSRLGRSWPLQAYRSAPPVAAAGTAYTHTGADTLTLVDENAADWAGAEALADTLVSADAGSDRLAHPEALADTLTLVDASTPDWAGAEPLADTLTLVDANASAQNTHTWTYADGSAWPAPWITSTVSGNGVVDVQGNRGRMLTDGGGPARAQHGTADYADIDLTVTLSRANPSTGQYSSIAFRGDTYFTGQDYWNNGYHVSIRGPENFVRLYRFVAGVDTLLASVAHTFTDGVDWKVRLRAAGSSLKVKIWDAAGSEPGTWGIDTTDATYTTGKLGVGTASVSGLSAVHWDDFTWTTSLTGTAYTETLADTLVLADALVVDWAGADALADTLVLADVEADRLAHAESLSDALALTDVGVGDWVGAEALSDALSLADAESDTAAFAQPLADTVIFADAVAEGYRWTEALSRTLFLTDAAAEVVAGVEALADTVVFSDASAEGRRFTQDSADALAFMDVAGAVQAMAEGPAESLVLVDVESDSADFIQGLPDTAFFTDASSDTHQGAAGTAYGETLADTLTLITAVADAHAGGETAADTLALADSLTDARAGVSATIDTLTLTDAGGDVASFTGASADTLTLLDDAAQALAGVETVADLLALLDAAAVDWAGVEALGDTLTLSDSVGHTSSFTVALADLVAFTDQVVDDYAGVLGFSYANLLEHVRAAIEDATGRTTFVTQATGRPTFPYCVVQLFGHSGRFDHTWAVDNVVTSLYLQLDGVGRSWRDSMWMIDRAVATVRTMALPPGVADYTVIGRSAPTPLESEGVVAIAQRVNLRTTRAPA